MTILIVEDDQAIVYVLKEYFRETKRTCISAPSVERTLKILAGISPKAVLLDFILDDGDAEPIIVRLRENGDHKGCKIILMTACQQIEKLCLEYEIPHMLKKPFGFDELERVINL